MGYIDPDTAVLIIVVWTLFRDFFLAPVLVRREIEKHATAIVEAFFVGIAMLLRDPAKKAALEGILGELAPLLKGAVLKGVGGKAPTFKEMLMMGFAQKFGLLPQGMLGGPGQGAPQGAPPEPASGPETAKRSPFWRR